MPVDIVIDPGRRLVKAARMHEGHPVGTVVPSVAGIGDTDVGQLSLGDLAKQPPPPEPYQVTLNDLTCLVGEGTGRYVASTEGLDLLWPHDGLLVKALLYSLIYHLLGPGEHDVTLHIASHENASTDAFEDWAREQHTFEVDGDAVYLNVSGVESQLAAWGAMCFWRMDSGEPPDISGETVGVLDIGYSSMLLSAFAEGDFIYQRRWRFGTSQFIGALQELIEERYDRSISLFDIDRLLYADGHVHTAQGVEDVGALTRRVRTALAAQVLNFAVAQNVEGFDLIVLTGGGAELLSDELPTLHRQTVLLSEPITAAVRGLAYITQKGRGKYE